eukprot:3467025-Rhodomonas_salina.1
MCASFEHRRRTKRFLLRLFTSRNLSQLQLDPYTTQPRLLLPKPALPRSSAAVWRSSSSSSAWRRAMLRAHATALIQSSENGSGPSVLTSTSSSSSSTHTSESSSLPHWWAQVGGTYCGKVGSGRAHSCPCWTFRLAVEETCAKVDEDDDERSGAWTSRSTACSALMGWFRMEPGAAVEGAG